MKPIYVSEPHLPSRASFDRYVDQIWQRRLLTNCGPLATELETRVASYLGLERMAFVSNGTIALQLALEALGVTGEVITTSFSFVATVSCIAWQGLVPVVVDVDPETLNIDVACIEAAITPRTTCILATHVFGNPCDVVAIEKLAEKHGLKVIYDGAHAFGAKINGRSLLSYGDAATVSFHATKLFQSGEGGGVYMRDPEAFKRMTGMRNFGIGADGGIDQLGINGKNSEFHAAMGLCSLDEIDEIIQRRRAISELYDRLLGDMPLSRPTMADPSDYNFAYYPVIFNSEDELLAALKLLAEQNVFARRYFYPSLSNLPYLPNKADTPVADDVSRRIACLPLHTNMNAQAVRRIAHCLRGYFKANEAPLESAAAVY